MFCSTDVEDDPFTVKVLRHVELIDDEASEYGIKIVKCSDRLMAKKYGFRNPPGVTYFRKGKYINYDGKTNVLTLRALEKGFILFFSHFLKTIYTLNALYSCKCFKPILTHFIK